MRPYLLLFLQAIVGMNQGVTRSEHVISTNIGENVTLECVADLTFFYLSTWRQNGTAIFIGTNLNPQFSKGSRFHLTGNHKKGEFFLRINDVTEDDLGIYWCETQDNHGAVQREITLSLRSTTKIQEPNTTDSTRNTEISRTVSEEEPNTTDSTRNTEISRTVSEDTDSTSDNTKANDKESTFLSSLALNWTFVFSGLVGACFIIVLALSILCIVCICRKLNVAKIKAPDENAEVERFQEHRPSTIDNSSSYDYIDEITLMRYNETAHRLDPSLMPYSDSPVFSNRSYLDILEERVEVQLHSYQSLTEMNNIEAPHHYTQVKHPLKPNLAICSHEFIQNCRPYSMIILQNDGKTNSVHEKRANSWPEYDRKCGKDVTTGNSHKISVETSQVAKTNSEGARWLLSATETKRKHQNNAEMISQNKSTDKSVKNHLQTSTSAILETEKILTPSSSAEDFRTCSSRNYSIGSVGLNIDTLCQIDTTSGSICLSEFESSSDNNSEDKIRSNVPLKDSGQYEDLSKNNFDDVHDYNMSSAPLSLNIF